MYEVSMRRDSTLETLDDAEARVRYLLRRIALILDPDAGQLNSICVKYNWHETTVSRWQARGGVPRDKAKLLYADFNKLIGFNMEDLVGDNCEQE
jgi:hypothetical protein